MRCLLASAPHEDTFGYSMPPPGLLRLGGELRRRGFAVALDDLAFRLANGELEPGEGLARTSAERLAAGGAEVVGLSVMGATLPIAIAIARHLRRLAPRTYLLLGGPGAGGVDEALLERFGELDAVVRGEAEVTLPELLERLREESTPRGVDGVTWRTRSGRVVRERDREPIADLESLPEPAWDLLPSLARYKALTGEAEGLTPVDSGRGCVYDCSFCSIGRYWQRRSRPLPAERLAREVAAIRALPGARNAYLCHDLFAADRRHALAFCDALERLTAGSTRVPWECRARADHLDRELLARMGAAGCYRVLLGIESADPVVRRRNQKGMRDDADLLQVVDDCASAGVTPILSIILGLPGEDEGALGKSLDFAADAALRAGVQLSFHLVNPQPGCALGEEYGERARPLEGIPPDMAWGAGGSDEERALVAEHPDLFSTFALLPESEEHLRDLHAIARDLPALLMRHPRTFALLRRRGIGDGHAGLGSLELYRAWRTSGRSFATFALARRDPLVEDALRWEEAIVRVGARGGVPAPGSLRIARDPRGTGPLHASSIPRRSAELVHARHDLSRLGSRLVGSAETPELPAAPTWLAVSPGERGVATLRVSPDVVQLLEAVDGRQNLASLESTRPGIGRALAVLADRGLVEFSESPR